jgi:hypothetical protein
MSAQSAEIVRQFENNAIYVTMGLRGAEPGFHWGIFVPLSTPQGWVWHATNRTGGWQLEVKESSTVHTSMSLCLAFKIGAVTDVQAFGQVLVSVPSSGQPSANTGEAFTCRVWVKDALHALHAAGIIKLEKSIDEIESEALTIAEGHRMLVEQGQSSALVINKTGYSTTS